MYTEIAGALEMEEIELDSRFAARVKAVDKYSARVQRSGQSLQYRARYGQNKFI